MEETKNAYLALFSQMATDQELHEQLEILFSQLAIFVYETGFWDVGYSNIPLLINSEIPKIVLVDLNDLFDEDAETFLGHKKDGILGLLERFHKDFHEAIVNSAAKHSGSTAYNVMQKLDGRGPDRRWHAATGQRRQRRVAAVRRARVQRGRSRADPARAPGVVDRRVARGAARASSCSRSTPRSPSS